MTIEDPIEFLHTHKKCIVNQRELGSDATSFAAALKAALRQDPDVILVGEMRDLETISTAMTAAETGHLVFATLHTQDTPQTIDRIIDVFPPEQQSQVRVAARGRPPGRSSPSSCCRRPTARAAACAAEVLVPTPAVRNLIREGKTHQIYSVLQTGGAPGMQTMDAALAGLVRAGQDHAPARRAARPRRRRSCGACWASGGAACRLDPARWRRLAHLRSHGHLRLPRDRPRRRARQGRGRRRRPSRRSPTSSRRAG